jgi:nitroreductase
MDLCSVEHLLTTTRSVRKRLDFSRPVDLAIVERCIEIALQAPTGANSQGWHFIVVTDPQKRKAIGDVYRKGMEDYASVQGANLPTFPMTDVRARQFKPLISSSWFLNKHIHEAPVLIIAGIDIRMEEYPQLFRSPTSGPMYESSLYGSVLPAVWSLMLALRARGLGSAWTTVHLVHHKEAADILEIPDNILQVAMLPVAYYTGTDFKLAKRLPVHSVTHWNSWNQHRRP